MPELSARQQRVADLAALPALPDAYLLARCIAAIELSRRARGDMAQADYRSDAWFACVDSNREEIFLEAIAEVKRREQAASANNAKGTANG